MKLLVITHEGQGKRKNDFCFPEEGEIAFFGSECDHEKVDGACGCKRSMVGLDSLTGSTTMKVADVSITRQELEERLSHHFMENWNFDAATAKTEAAAMATQLIRLVMAFPVGALIERRGSRLQGRERSA
jgi:hypothetical protein